jgi:hypothetical protein
MDEPVSLGVAAPADGIGRSPYLLPLLHSMPHP